ncbi:MAG TPA: ATP-binding protein [Beijerinckiaceae bacterium]|jgi:PAS domain S-box-containing protein
MRLRSKLALTFGMLSLAAGVIGTGVVERVTTDRLREQTGQTLAATADRLREQLDQGMHERWRDVHVLAAVARTTSASAEARRSWIETLQASQPNYSWIGFASRDGLVTASTGGMLEGKSVATRPWFKAALDRSYAGDVHEALLLAKMLPPSLDGGPLRFVDVAVPTSDATGRADGVLGAHISWDWARTLTQEIVRQARVPGLEALILREDGDVVLGPAATQGRRYPVAPRQAGGPDYSLSTVDGVTYFVGTARSTGIGDYPGLGWTIVMRQPVGLAYAPIEDARRQILLAGAALALLLGGAGWWSAGRIAGPLLALAQAAQAIEQRGRAGDVALPKVGGFAEIDALSQALRTLLRRLSERDVALEQANAELESRVVARTRALAQSEAFAHSIVDSSPDCVKVLDFEGRVVFVNATGVCLLELEDALEIGGHLFETLWPEEDRAAVAERIARVAAGGAERFTTCVPTAKGRPKWWDISLNPILSADGRPERILVVSRDISTLKAVEGKLLLATEEAERQRVAAERASEAKTEFLAAMSHEIRTPLNGILGYTEILLEDRAALLDESHKRTAERIRSAGSALLTVVNDILDFSKIEAGQIDLEPRPFRLETLIDNTLSIVAGSGKAGVTLSVDVADDLPPIMTGDEDRLRQILLNLLNNAVKFTPKGSVTLSVRSARSTDGQALVHFAVTDTGIGIPKDKQSLLFERFSQVDGSIGREFGGTGLGLAISKRLVTLMQGTIGVESAPGQGSTFWFTACLSEAQMRLDEAKPASDEIVIHPARLLLVEDLPMNQELAGHLLRSAGHSVDIVGDGADAVVAVQTERYDLVLMDIHMPGMDGVTATRHIRALGGVWAEMPILALTANVLPDQIAEFRRAGMTDHVGKPFKRADLLRAIERSRGHAPTADAVTPPAAQASLDKGALDQGTLGELVTLVGSEQVEAWLSELAAILGQGMPDPGRDDLSRVEAAAHKLVSQAGMLGFQDLSEAARAVEEACRGAGDVSAPLAAMTASAGRALQILASSLPLRPPAAASDDRSAA